MPVLALVLDLDGRLLVLLDDLEWPMLLITLNIGILDLATNETFGIEDSVFRVSVVSVLRGVANETLFIREADPRGGDTMTLVVGDNLDTTTTLYTTKSK